MSRAHMDRGFAITNGFFAILFAWLAWRERKDEP